MKSQEHTITSGMYIGFEVCVAKFNCFRKGRHGVFGCVTRTAAMSKSNRKLRFKKWMRHESTLDTSASGGPVFVFQETFIQFAGGMTW